MRADRSAVGILRCAFSVPFSYLLSRKPSHKVQEEPDAARGSRPLPFPATFVCECMCEYTRTSNYSFSGVEEVVRPGVLVLKSQRLDWAVWSGALGEGQKTVG